MFREGSSPGECFMCSNTICRVSGQKRTGRCGGTEDGWVCSEPAGLELPRQGQPPTSPKPTAPALGPANVNSSGAVGIDSEGGDNGGGGGGDAAMAAVWCTVAVLVVAGLALALFAWWRKRQTGRGGPAPAPRGQPAYNNNRIFPPPHSPRRSNTDASVPNPVFHAYVEPVQGQPDAYYAAKASASAVDYSKVDDDAGTAGSRGKLRCGDGPAYVDEARAPTGGSTYAECTDAGAGDGAERRCTWAGGRGRCTNVLLPGAPVGLCNKHTCANVNNGCARGKASMDLVCTACSAAPAAPGQRQGRGGIVRGERKGSILHGFDGEGTSA